MIWAKLRQLYLDGTGNPTAAAQEEWIHLTEGRRRVLSEVEAPQIYKTADITVTADTDSVNLASALTDLYHLSTVFNKTDGIPCHEEPDGMGGRNRLLQKTSGKPYPGQVTHWWRDGTLLLVRGMPAADTTLQVRYMVQPAPLTDADINLEPITPPQYDMAIVQYAIASYLSLHPGDNTVLDPDRNLTRLQVALDQARTGTAQPKQVYRQENLQRRESMRLPGYSVTPRGRMAG